MFAGTVDGNDVYVNGLVGLVSDNGTQSYCGGVEGPFVLELVSLSFDTN